MHRCALRKENMFMKKIRWGIVGPGNIANKFAVAIKNVECAELAAVAARSMEKGSEFAARYGIPKVFGGYDAMAASDEVDAVYIATPHPFHKPCAELCLKAGKHVLCEKPLCINEAQAVALKECAKEHGVFLMEAMWTRFLPAVKEACAIVASGAIGEVMGLTVRISSRTPCATPTTCSAAQLILSACNWNFSAPTWHTGHSAGASSPS